MKISKLILVGLCMVLCSCRHSADVRKDDDSKESEQNNCATNFTVEGSFFAGKIYKSYKDYKNISTSKAFNSAIVALTTNGWQILNSNKDIGLISAAQGSAFGKGATVPLNVLIQNRTGKGIRVELTFKNNPGDISSSDRIAEEFCKIYASISPNSNKSFTPEKSEESDPDQNKKIESRPKSADTINSNANNASMIVNASKANIRAEPSKDGKVITTVKKGYELKILLQKDDWYQVELPGGKTGWCHKSLLTR